MNLHNLHQDKKSFRLPPSRTTTKPTGDHKYFRNKPAYIQLFIYRFKSLALSPSLEVLVSHQIGNYAWAEAETDCTKYVVIC